MSRRPPVPREQMLARAVRAWSPGGHRGRVLASEAPVSRGPSAVRTVRVGGSGSDAVAVGYPPDATGFWETYDFHAYWYEGPGYSLADVRPGLTSACVGRLRFTLATVDPNITWFQADTGGFSSGEATYGADVDPHYPTVANVPQGYGYCASIVTGNRYHAVEGGPFSVGQVIDFTFTADTIIDPFTSEMLRLPYAFSTDDAMFYVVSP